MPRLQLQPRDQAHRDLICRFLEQHGLTLQARGDTLLSRVVLTNVPLRKRQ
jgi:hypothetical protein